MASIRELRERSKTVQELQQQKVERVKNTVNQIINSDAMNLTILNQLGRDGAINEEKVQDLANQVAAEVTKAVLDPVVEFEGMCAARGMNRTQIRSVVETLSKTFKLEPDGTFEIKKEAVALYLSKNPHLYEDLDILT